MVDKIRNAFYLFILHVKKNPDTSISNDLGKRLNIYYSLFLNKPIINFEFR